jgi:hypothetical protein
MAIDYTKTNSSDPIGTVGFRDMGKSIGSALPNLISAFQRYKFNKGMGKGFDPASLEGAVDAEGNPMDMDSYRKLVQQRQEGYEAEEDWDPDTLGGIAHNSYIEQGLLNKVGNITKETGSKTMTLGKDGLKKAYDYMTNEAIPYGKEIYGMYQAAKKRESAEKDAREWEATRNKYGNPPELDPNSPAYSVHNDEYIGQSYEDMDSENQGFRFSGPLSPGESISRLERESLGDDYFLNESVGKPWPIDEENLVSEEWPPPSYPPYTNMQGISNRYKAGQPDPGTDPQIHQSGIPPHRFSASALRSGLLQELINKYRK